MAKKNFKGGLSEVLGNNSGSLELTILPELKSLIPPLTEEEKNLLKESILKDGVKDPLDVWIHDNQATIIDGHNRYEIATDLGIAFGTKEHLFDHIEQVKDWMLKKQLGRRNLTDANRTYLIGLLYNRSKVEKGKYDRIDNNKHSIDVAQKISKSAGVTDRSVRNAAKYTLGLDKLSDDFKSEILGGKEKVSKADIQKIADVKCDKKIQNKKQLNLLIQNSNKKSRNINNSSQSDNSYVKEQNRLKNQLKDFDRDVLYSVFTDFLTIKTIFTDQQKLVKGGFSIIRKIDRPLGIDILDKKKFVWVNYKNGFSSKAERDKIFIELLQDNKTIQG